MSLTTISDAFLARRAAGGDHAAFAELARRYRPLIRYHSACPPAGVDVDDLRQAGLLGLLETCRRWDPAKGPFAGLAKCNVRQRIGAACRHARTIKHRLLSDAVHDREEPGLWLQARVAAPDGDPVRALELREELRDYAERTRKRDRRRRYTDEQAARALALLAEGNTIKQAAFAVGASSARVARWAQQTGQQAPGKPRRFTGAEIEHAVELVREGASLRDAAAAVGATGPTVLRWARASDQQPRRRRARTFTPAEIERAIELVRAGGTLDQAAAVVGTTKCSVSRWVRKAA